MLFVENISGFTQDVSDNGIIELHEKILASMDDYSPLAVRVRARRHNENWKAIALNYHMLRRKYPEPEPFVIVVNAYSYGVGHGLTRFARQLNRYGLRINHATLCDGVYYHWHPLGWWRALIGNSRVQIPNNVDQFYAFYQRKNIPQGRQPMFNEVTTKRLGWEELHVEHQWMDDEIQWHNYCIKTVKELARRAVRGGSNSVPTGSPETAATESRLAN